MTAVLIALLLVNAVFNVVVWPRFYTRVAKDPRARGADGKPTRFLVVHAVLIALALVNLLALHRARSWRAVEDGGPVAARVRWAAGVSALCWLGVLVAGRMIGFL